MNSSVKELELVNGKWDGIEIRSHSLMVIDFQFEVEQMVVAYVFISSVEVFCFIAYTNLLDILLNFT